MKFITLAFLICLLVVAIVSAVPADETLAGNIYGEEAHNPADPQSFFKLKKLKKLLLG